MKKTSDVAREYVAAINALNFPGLMMSTHDRGKEQMARAILELVEARDDASLGSEDRLIELIDEL